MRMLAGPVVGATRMDAGDPTGRTLRTDFALDRPGRQRRQRAAPSGTRRGRRSRARRGRGARARLAAGRPRLLRHGASAVRVAATVDPRNGQSCSPSSR
ncbi:hypothetical protein V2I01_40460 [Micromonospora sp. BRA006-A]|nr:hypothetical protein [Micromonospora sp. BRA006-A]